MNSKMWMACIVALLAICLVMSAFLLRPGEASAAQVWSDGQLLYTLDLRVDRTVMIQTERGTNVVTVQDGCIAVTDADCPDGYCVKRGFQGGGLQIVCLPNRLVIKFLAETEIDAVVG